MTVSESEFSVLLVPSFHQTLDQVADVTVEAEYGSQIWEGVVYTAAHHQKEGPYAGDHVVAGGRPSPCNDSAIPELVGGGIIGISHMDLDTLGGCGRAMGWKLFGESPSHKEFWEVAGQVDVRGPHKLEEILKGREYAERTRLALQAWWAWSQDNRCFPDRLHGAAIVTNVTVYVEKALGVLERILSDEGDLLDAGSAWAEERRALGLAGVEWAEKQRALGLMTIKSVGTAVLTRVTSEAFVNHLYNAPSGAAYEGVVSLNTTTGACTLSLAMPIKGVSCRAIVQALWGPEAGGHDGIAGSPRGRTMTEQDCWLAGQVLESAIASAKLAE